jgi:hypothetical protein
MIDSSFDIMIPRFTAESSLFDNILFKNTRNWTAESSIYIQVDCDSDVIIPTRFPRPLECEGLCEGFFGACVSRDPYNQDCYNRLVRCLNSCERGNRIP